MGGHGTCPLAPVCKAYFKLEPKRVKFEQVKSWDLTAEQQRDSNTACCLYPLPPPPTHTRIHFRIAEFHTVFIKTFTTVKEIVGIVNSPTAKCGLLRWSPAAPPCPEGRRRNASKPAYERTNFQKLLFVLSLGEK